MPQVELREGDVRALWVTFQHNLLMRTEHVFHKFRISRSEYIKSVNYSQNASSIPPKNWLMRSLIQSRFDSWLQISKSQPNIVIIQP